MAININNLSNTSQVKQTVDKQTQIKQQSSQVSNAGEQAKMASRDSVSLTPQAQQMSQVQKKADQAPAVDQKKIDKLKKAIESGEYKVNPEKLAASIAKFEFSLT